MTLHTVGHGTLSADELAQLLRTAGIELVVDIRTHPRSRRHPHFGRAAMEQWLPEHKLAYEWEPALGGRRKPRSDSLHSALKVPAFRGYAEHMETAEFGAALDGVLEEAATQPTAVMCAESLWWRCSPFSLTRCGPGYPARERSLAGELPPLASARSGRRAAESSHVRSSCTVRPDVAGTDGA